jgi:hypothetical protein
VHAYIFVLRHDSSRLGKRSGDVKILIEVQCRRGQARAKVHLVAIACNCKALDRTNIDTRIAFDAALGRECRFDVAVEASFYFGCGLFGCESELYFDVQLFEPLHQIDVLHLLP